MPIGSYREFIRMNVMMSVYEMGGEEEAISFYPTTPIRF
jgi:hypothetical protein